ncbi:MAG: hypothetical protein RL291_9 [Pseudomonadota bacterium]|jgi:AraC-like DNA-binding protein
MLHRIGELPTGHKKRPGMTEAIVRSRIFVGLAGFLEPQGVKLDDLLRAQGLPRHDALPETIPLAKAALVYEAAAQKLGDPCLGLRFAEHIPVGAMGPLTFLLTQAESVRHALETASAYIQGVASKIHMCFEVGPEGVGRLEWMFSDDIDAPLTQIIDLLMASGLNRLGAVTGTPVVPIRAEISHGGLPCADLVQRYFGSQVKFNTARSVLYFDPTTLGRRNPTYNAYLYETVITAAKALVLQTPEDSSSIVTLVRQSIEQRLGIKSATLDDVASDLALQPRSLQWQLEQAGTTYEKQFNDVRRVIAARLLTTTEMPLIEIAGALGFGQQSSFSRACQSLWFGMSPSRYRGATVDQRQEALEALERERQKPRSGESLSDVEETG